MLTYTTLQNRPREFLAATGRTLAEFVRVLPAFAASSTALSPPDKTLEGQARQRRLVTHGRQAALHARLSDDQPPAHHAWCVLQAAPLPDPLLDASCAAGLAARLRRSRPGAR